MDMTYTEGTEEMSNLLIPINLQEWSFTHTTPHTPPTRVTFHIHTPTKRNLDNYKNDDQPFKKTTTISIITSNITLLYLQIIIDLKNEHTQSKYIRIQEY